MYTLKSKVRPSDRIANYDYIAWGLKVPPFVSITLLHFTRYDIKILVPSFILGMTIILNFFFKTHSDLGFNYSLVIPYQGPQVLP